MSSIVFKSTVPGNKGPQTHALVCTANGLLPYGLLSPDMSSLFETKIFNVCRNVQVFGYFLYLKVLYNINALYIHIFP